MPRSIFIAATGQNVGKTTLCLGILAALYEKFDRIGFIKPIGQQHVEITDCPVPLQVDKDVVLFKEYFGLKANYSDMSPVILPAGFTRQFLDEKINLPSIESSIKQAFKNISQDNNFTIVEGTGHVGVGSIIHLCNAKVASLLGLDMVIIASGGLGSAIDELALNFAMCEKYGVNVRGVILNRVLDDKREMITSYFPKALKRWNIPLIGCIPYNAFLNAPTLKDYETLFDTKLIAGHKHRYCHFQYPRLIAGSLEAYEEEIKEEDLIITPASREDIIQATLDRKKRAHEQGRAYPLHGIILTGRQEPKPAIISALEEADVPALYAPVCSYDAMKMISSFIAKIRVEDKPKIEKAIELTRIHLTLDLLI